MTTVITMLCVCCAFIVSYIPRLILVSLDHITGNVPVWLYILHSYAYSINTITNPFIYTATNKKFRDFLKSMYLSKFGLSTRSFAALPATAETDPID